MEPLPSHILLSTSVRLALETHQPIVALESTVVTHGLPYPQNLQLAQDMEAEVTANGAVPATIAVLAGVVHAGLSPEELESLATGRGMVKISTRDFAPTRLHKRSGGTTVAGTLAVAEAVGIKVFATGGIGGVHQGAPFDISTDLPMLAKTPLVVVCAGAKAILDLPATLEQLETLGVPVVGYQTDEFPAFYSRSSGLPVSARVDSPEKAAALARLHWEMGMESAVLLVQPPPEAAALPAEQVNEAIGKRWLNAKRRGSAGRRSRPSCSGGSAS